MLNTGIKCIKHDVLITMMGVRQLAGSMSSRPIAANIVGGYTHNNDKVKR